MTTVMCLFGGFGGNFRNETQVKDSAETRTDGLLFDLKKHSTASIHEKEQTKLD